MNRLTKWDEELGSYIGEDNIANYDYGDLINYIGQLEDALFNKVPTLCILDSKVLRIFLYKKIKEGFEEWS